MGIFGFPRSAGTLTAMRFGDLRIKGVGDPRCSGLQAIIAEANEQQGSLDAHYDVPGAP